MSDWAEVGAKPVVKELSFAERINPMDDKVYVKILERLQASHAQLLQIDKDLDQNPVLTGQIMGELRLNANRLFVYMNQYIDAQIELSEEYARLREKLYIEQLELGKSPSAAEKYSSELTRVQANAVNIAKLRLDQIKNNYNRYDGIAIYLASRLKGMNTERMLG